MGRDRRSRWRFTLYDELQAYQADEVAAGLAPLFVTSGGQPVYSSATYYLQTLNVCGLVT
jgi:hypothetical protein